MNGVKKGSIPDRWLRCPRKAQDLIMGKFLAFKTPLDHNYNSQMPADCRFYPSMVFETCKSKKVRFTIKK